MLPSSIQCCCNMLGTLGNIEVLHFLSSTDKQGHSKRDSFSLGKGKGERAEGVGLKKALPLNEEMRWKNHVSHFNKKDHAISL